MSLYLVSGIDRWWYDARIRWTFQVLTLVTAPLVPLLAILWVSTRKRIRQFTPVSAALSAMGVGVLLVPATSKLAWYISVVYVHFFWPR